MLNPALDRQALAEEFKIDDRILILDVLRPNVAEKIHSLCLTEVPFEFVFVQNGKNRVMPAQKMAAMSRKEQRELQRELFEAASIGEGFLYCGYMMSRANFEASNDKLRFLHQVFEYLNSAEMLKFVCDLSGRNDLLSADAQFTRYTGGQYLTRHRDVVSGRERKLAYVLGLSKGWHPDWGGLLQFYRDDGTPRDAWNPTFNSLVLFDVRHVHAVTYVAPDALAPRLSLAGWFRAVPGESGVRRSSEGSTLSS